MVLYGRRAKREGERLAAAQAAAERLTARAAAELPPPPAELPSSAAELPPSAAELPVPAGAPLT